MSALRESSIENLGSVKTGPFGTQLHQRDYVKKDGTPIVTVEHLSEKGLLHRNLPLVSDADKNRLSQYLLKTNDIVFSRVGSVDRCSIVSEKENGWLFSGRLLRIRIKENCASSKYLVQLFQTESFRHYMRSVAVGGTMPSLNTEILSKVKVSLPPLPEQQAIAEILQTWDTAIEKTEKLITAKEKQFRWLVDMLIRRRCKVWGHLKTENIFSIVSERNKKNEQLLSVTQDRGVIPRSMLEGRVMSPAGSTSNYKVIRKGNFAIGLRSFQGGIEYSEYSGAVSPAYTVLKSKREICEGFYKHFFKTRLFVDKYLRIAVIGIRDGKQISMPDFETIQLPYPPLAEQRQIAIFLDSAKREILTFRELVRQYQKQKRGLMQKLLTGEWRTKISS